MKQPDLILSNAVAKVIGIGFIPYNVIVITVSLLAYALTAAAVQAWVGNGLMKLLGIGVVRANYAQREEEVNENESEEDA
jgi:hypothetical protein